MNRRKKEHPNFEKYAQKIREMEPFKSIPYKEKWVVGNKGAREERKKWADKLIEELINSNKIDSFALQKGKYKVLMYYIHPFKMKPCSICGKELSLKYIYPNRNLYKKLGFKGEDKEKLYFKFYTVGELYNILDEERKEKLLEILGIQNIEGFDKLIDNKTGFPTNPKLMHYLSPGAMSNFPDRLDGFHTYNICCREREDKGRHKENMATYNEDRRVYEFWNDGDIQRAKAVVGYITKKLKKSADHVGPISLGFVNDPINLVPVNSVSENSAKRNILRKEDMEYLIKIEKERSIPVISWYSKGIWNYIKRNYEKMPILTINKMLQQNVILSMNILNEIRKARNGEEFLLDYFINNKLKYIFKKSEVIEHKKGEKFFEYEFSEKKYSRAEKERYYKDRGPRKYLEGLEKFCEEKNNRKLEEKFKNLMAKILNHKKLDLLKSLIEERKYVEAKELLEKFINETVKEEIIKLHES